MKLASLFEFKTGPEERARLHSKISRAYRSDREKWIIAVVRNHLLDGSSAVNLPLSAGQINMDDIIDAIKSKRCIPSKEQDIGHTYVRNLVGNAIRSEFKRDTNQNKYDISVNEARKVFGLPPVKRRSKS